jgi:hypothetical protein
VNVILSCHSAAAIGCANLREYEIEIMDVKKMESINKAEYIVMYIPRIFEVKQLCTFIDTIKPM